MAAEVPGSLTELVVLLGGQRRGPEFGEHEAGALEGIHELVEFLWTPGMSGERNRRNGYIRDGASSGRPGF